MEIEIVVGGSVPAGAGVVDWPGAGATGAGVVWPAGTGAGAGVTDGVPGAAGEDGAGAPKAGGAIWVPTWLGEAGADPAGAGADEDGGVEVVEAGVGTKVIVDGTAVTMAGF